MQNIIILITTAVSNFFEYMPTRLNDQKLRENFLIGKLKTDIDKQEVIKRKSVRQRRSTSVASDSVFEDGGGTGGSRIQSDGGGTRGSRVQFDSVDITNKDMGSIT